MAPSRHFPNDVWIEQGLPSSHAAFASSCFFRWDPILLLSPNTQGGFIFHTSWCPLKGMDGLPPRCPYLLHLIFPS